MFSLYQELRIQFYIAFNSGLTYWLPWEPQKQNEMRDIRKKKIEEGEVSVF